MSPIQPQSKVRIERVFTIAVIALWLFVPIAAIVVEHRVDPHVMGIAATGVLTGWLTTLFARKFSSDIGSYPFFVSYMLVGSVALRQTHVPGADWWTIEWMLIVWTIAIACAIVVKRKLRGEGPTEAPDTSASG